MKGVSIMAKAKNEAPAPVAEEKQAQEYTGGALFIGKKGIHTFERTREDGSKVERAMFSVGLKTEEGTKYGTMFCDPSFLKDSEKNPNIKTYGLSNDREYDVSFKKGEPSVKMLGKDILEQNEAYTKERRAELRAKANEAQASAEVTAEAEGPEME